MRLIDADKINFEEVFGGQSDFAKDLRKAAQELIGSQPTAFDKEKVIEELIELRQKEYSDSDEESELSDGEEIYDEGRSQGRFEAYHRAVDIVKKGGIE